jgi:hypothetical protein
MNSKSVSTTTAPGYEGRFIKIRIDAMGSVDEPFDPLPYLNAYVQARKSGSSLRVGCLFAELEAMLSVESSWPLVADRNV